MLLKCLEKQYSACLVPNKGFIFHITLPGYHSINPLGTSIQSSSPFLNLSWRSFYVDDDHNPRMTKHYKVRMSCMVVGRIWHIMTPIYLLIAVRIPQKLPFDIFLLPMWLWESWNLLEENSMMQVIVCCIYQIKQKSALGLHTDLLWFCTFGSLMFLIPPPTLLPMNAPIYVQTGMHPQPLHFTAIYPRYLNSIAHACISN